LRWSFKWRKELRTGFYYQLLERGFIKDSDQEPDTVGFEFYFDAFEELSTSRQVGFSVGPIPFTAIAEYFRIFELDDFMDFVYIIRKLDNTFIEINAAAASAADKTPDGGNSATGTTSKKHSSKGRHRAK
jgi:hypothetical protein